jgi:RHS repeat-associated protein
LLDEQFKPVQNGIGFDLINATADAFKAHSFSITPAKSGYLYVYCSNESNQDVYFDNLQVVHTRGPLLNEMQYYPNGLMMYGLVSRAYGKLQTNFGYQGKEMQNGEFYDGSGLEEYDFVARFYDPQLGRWHNQDPARQFASPYSAMANNPVIYGDPNGKFIWFVIAAAALIGGGLNLWANKDHVKNFWQGLGYFGAGAAGAVGGLYFGPLAAIGIGGLGTIEVDGFSSGFGNLDFGDYLSDFINGGLSSLAGSDAGIDIANATGGWGNTTGTSRFLGHTANSGELNAYGSKFFNSVFKFLNGDAGEHLRGISGFVSKNIDFGIRNVLNSAASDFKTKNNHLLDYLAFFGSGSAANALGNSLFPQSIKVNDKDINLDATKIGNLFSRNFVTNSIQSGFNNVIGGVQQHMQFGNLLSTFYRSLFPVFENDNGDIDYSNLIGDLPFFDWRHK